MKPFETVDETPLTSRQPRLGPWARANGYTEKAVRRMIEKGVWAKGYEYWRTPTGRIVIDIEGTSATVVSQKSSDDNRKSADCSMFGRPIGEVERLQE